MKSTIQAVLKSVLFACATLWVASAQADGFYIGAGAYQTDMSIDDFDDDDYVPAGFVGYQFLDTNLLMLSGELGYYDLGDFSGSDYDVDASAVTLAGVAYLPLGPFFEIYAKAGVASVSVDVETFGNKDDYDGEEAFGGAGFAFDILDTIDIYVEYLVFDTEVDSEMVGVGIRLDF
ncbi:MAG: outer membrane beta-barrel protein [Halioglobus sp.]